MSTPSHAVLMRRSHWPLLFSGLLALSACTDPADDNTPSQTPNGASETPNPSTDADNDGFNAATDCNDNNPDVFPDAPESCNGLDDNCNNATDEGVLSSFYLDEDGDGFGEDKDPLAACSAPIGYVSLSGDCDDQDPKIFPDAEGDECLDGKDINCDGLVGALVSAGTTLTIPVQTLLVPFTVTLNGATLSSANAGATDYGAIRLLDTLTGEIFRIGDLWNTTLNQPSGSFTVPLLPGIYDVLYTVQDDGPLSPDNEDARIQSGLVITSAAPVNVAVKYVTVTFNVTLNGNALSSANTSASDYGSLSLRDTDTGEKFPLFDFWVGSTSQPRGSYAARLIPGTYDVIYEGDMPGTRWPANSEVVLQTGVSLLNDTSLSVNVPTASVVSQVTLSGQNLNTSNTSASDHGLVELIDSEGSHIRVVSTWNSASNQVQPSGKVVVVPGTYDLVYSGVGGGSRWPVNKDAPIQAALNVSGDFRQDVALQPVSINVNVTLGGQTLSSSNTSASDFGALRLDPAGSGDFKLLDTWDGTNARPVSSKTVAVLPGIYDVFYAAGTTGKSWPKNGSVRLQQDVALSNNVALNVDVPTSAITCSLTLGGQAVSSSNTSATDYGRLFVKDSEGDTFELCSSFDSLRNQAVSSSSVSVMPGVYNLRYHVGQDGSRWPGNTDFTLKQDVVISGGQSVSLDVPPLNLTMVATLNGQAVSSANSSASSFGVLELWRTDDSDDVQDAFSSYNVVSGQISSSNSLGILPGSYQVVYQRGSLGVSWPANQGRPLSCFTLE
ncbi:MAG: putative metal-binding motif-containing protein [Myxococcota bacterium]